MNPDTLEKSKFLLKKYFGYDHFRPLQEDIISSITCGRDTLVLMPTGGGKSICFQLPALLFSGLTIVISPLIALMKDQVESLRANGIPAGFLNSTISQEQSAALIQSCRNGQTKLLYVSPEKLVNDFKMLTSLNISMFAIDEAHCISQWGHDFRPEYTQLKKLKRSFPNIPIIALTATADKVTRKDIAEQLSLVKPIQFLASFDRPNLSLAVRTGKKEKEKLNEILDFIEKRKNESGIIYCLSRNSCEKVAKSLKDSGINASYYHAGMAADKRSKIQDDFINDRIPIICATIAFGMGIDKSNVRFVIHFNLPKNMEGYYQEIGRAGRDGLPSDTLLYYSLSDVVQLSSFAAQSGQKELSQEKLNRIQQYAEAGICRRKILLSYFGEFLEDDCKNCDVCHNPRKKFDGTVIAQKAISALYRLEQKVSSGTLIDVLRGSKKNIILDNNFHLIKTFGAGATISYADWQKYLLQLLQLGLIEIAYDDNLHLKITKQGIDIVKSGKTIELLLPGQDETFKVSKTKELPVPKNDSEILFENLRRLRRRIAEEDNIPAYVVFSDATLKEMSIKQPLDEFDLEQISGVGQKKLENYGTDFLTEINLFVSQRAKAISVKKDTYEETLKLYNEGVNPEEIAIKRNLSSITIYSHIAYLYQKNEITDLSKLVSPKDIAQVKEVWLKLKRTDRMKTIYDELEGAIDYPQIRLSLSWLIKNEK
jgi:ATP-dependent DNA helicase RecQ